MLYSQETSFEGGRGKKGSSTHFCQRPSKFQGLVQLIGLGILKKFMTLLGLETRTFWVVGQCLNRVTTYIRCKHKMQAQCSLHGYYQELALIFIFNANILNEFSIF
jgi:hypothetical protein